MIEIFLTNSYLISLLDYGVYNFSLLQLTSNTAQLMSIRPTINANGFRFLGLT